MADEVIISGIGEDRNIPDFATEKTIKTMENALKQANMYNKNSTKYLAQLAMGDKAANLAMNKLAAEMKGLDSTVKDGIKKQQTNNEKANDFNQKQLGAFSKLMTLGKDTMNLHKKQFAEQIKNDQVRNKLLREYGNGEGGMSGTSAAIIAGLKGAGEVASKVAAGVVAVAAAVKGANNYLLQQGTDRFNFAQELRQSGLAAGLSESGASLTSFADKVRTSNFTLGEAAEFTQRFSKAVGVTGVDQAMSFVNSLAMAGDDGGDMMRRYGMEFGEVANISGEYLESVRALGMLDRMTNADMRNGMDKFMSTVVATSNIMKINMEDAAQMIKDTLGRDDITSLLATMDPDRAAQIQDVVGLAGGMQSELGEALAQRLAAGSQQEFIMSDAYSQLQSSPIAMELLPVIERLASASEQGGTQGFQQAFSSIGGDIQRIQEVATANRVLFTSGSDDYSMKVLAQLLRQGQTAGDATAGRQRLSADDTAVVGAIETQRQFTVAMEGVNNALVANSNFAENVTKINTANLALIEALETEASAVATSIAEPIFDVTTSLQAGVTTAIAGIASSVGEFARDVGVMGTESQKTADAVRAMRVSINETFGGGSVIGVDGNIVNRDIADMVARVAETEAKIAESSGYERDGLRFRLTQQRQMLQDEIDSIANTAPDAARQLRIETGINRLIGEGQTVQYDPDLLANQQRFGLVGPGQIQGGRDAGGYILQGGGRMETRESAIERIASQFPGIAGSASAIRSGNGTNLLESLGYDNDKMEFTETEATNAADMIKAMTDANILNQDQLAELLRELKNTTGSEGIFDFSNASAADTALQQRLITSVEALVTQLRE